MKRIYVVTCSDSIATEESLVKASSAAQAIRSIAEPMFKVRVATQEDLMQLAKTHILKEV